MELALDDITSGLQPSDLVVVAGRPSMGKTVFGDFVIPLPILFMGCQNQRS
jgi:replicative DNA helicase